MTLEEEIQHLLLYIEDDEATFQTVKNRLISLGADAIPYLEEYILLTPSALSKHRVQEVIACMAFEPLRTRFQEAIQSLEDLSVFAIIGLLFKLRNNKEEDYEQFYTDLDALIRKVWLDIEDGGRSAPSPIAQLRTIEWYLLQDYKMIIKGTAQLIPQQVAYLHLDHLLFKKKGNYVSFLLLMYVICEHLSLSFSFYKIRQGTKSYYTLGKEINQSALLFNIMNGGELIPNPSELAASSICPVSKTRFIYYYIELLHNLDAPYKKEVYRQIMQMFSAL